MITERARMTTASSTAVIEVVLALCCHRFASAKIGPAPPFPPFGTPSALSRRVRQHASGSLCAFASRPRRQHRTPPRTAAMSPEAADSDTAAVHVSKPNAKYPARALAMEGGGASDGGVYVDLGSIPFDGVLAESADVVDAGNLHRPRSHCASDHPATLEEWRAEHWIVLIDDESAIRLAIGDYLHSMGYAVVTACDGPMAFLEMLLWSCSWSLAGEGRGGTSPPWIAAGGDGEGRRFPPWRLPNCVISDIRMPGGIDGVQLLELLRRDPEVAEETDDVGAPKKKTKARNAYDEKDDFELLDAVMAEHGAEYRKERITTPTDQALQYIDSIRSCVDFLLRDQPATKGQGEWECQYPSSLQEVPVILLTAKAMVSDRVQGYQAGANGYIPKPFRPEELLGMVDNLMKRQERKRKYNAISARNQGAVQEDDDILDHLTLEEAEHITKEMVEIKQALRTRERQLTAEKAERERVGLAALLPEALWMLRTGERRKKVFTMEHIRSILALCFGAAFPRSHTRRDALLAELEARSAEEPDRLVSGLIDGCE